MMMMMMIIIILIKRCSLTRVKLTALYKHPITKNNNTLTYILANKTLIISISIYHNNNNNFYKALFSNQS